MREIPDMTIESRPGSRLRGQLSLMSLVSALLLLAATFFLMSPPNDRGFPGAAPWGDGSLLKIITNWMALEYRVATVRGVEIKDLAFHVAALIGLIVLAVRALISARFPSERRTAKRAWFIGQSFLTGWVLLSALSYRWSGDASLSIGQAALYALALAWAIALSWSLEGRDAPRLTWGYVAIAALGAVLCIWYFYRRNPFHRPGFPIGNPGALAACILPALLIAGFVMVGAIWRGRTSGVRIDWRRLAPALAAFIPLIWCFRLAGARGAGVAGIAGVAGVLFLRAKARLRWGITLACLGLAGLGAWYFPSVTQDVAMGRGATVRFRVYSWRYAAALWGRHQFAGAGAGAYPRLASGLSIGDRMLDPAAFMGEMVEHAHNELFEVFAEIGLVGGVTWVAGFLATLVAASALLRANLSPERRWLLMGLIAGVIGLLVDAMFTVNPRLPGAPAVFYTLLGVLWATSRAVSKYRSDEPPNSVDRWIRNMGLRRYGVTGTALIAAAAAHWLIQRNWQGVQAEFEAAESYRAGQYDIAIMRTREAGGLLLDPVRQLAARKLEVDSQFARALRAHAEAVAALEQDGPGAANVDSVSISTETRDLFRLAMERGVNASQAALAFNRQAPNIGRMSALGAQCAEMLADLSYRTGAREQARTWHARALQAWRSQLALRPFDMQALLRMAGYWQLYRTLPGDYVGLLRDALRNGFPPSEWRAALRKGAELPQFGETLEAVRMSAGPYDPRTDLDALILSRAPEMYRLSAEWKALSGDFRGAYEDAGRAIRLYQPMRARFPTLYSTALAEQAEYAARVWPAESRRPIALLREAIHALPKIQTHKYERMAMPYRIRLARHLDADGRYRESGELIRKVLRVQPNNFEAWKLVISSVSEQGAEADARAALEDAEQAGVRGAELKLLREILGRNFPGALDE